jgi:hypothetical protein
VSTSLVSVTFLWITMLTHVTFFGIPSLSLAIYRIVS